jgi:LacI family transcriptional regulator/LacI family repressor for deo operon, udp, cdd, tsx, nupC, and nupG
MMAVTIKDVAARADVSVSTVSRAFTMPAMVREPTRTRVLEIAREMGYQPNRAARGLVTSKTGNIGLVVPDLANPFFGAVLKGAHVRAREADYLVFLANTEENPATEDELIRAMVKQVDGIVLCSSRLADPELEQVLSSKPTVLLNRRVAGTPAVLLDSADGARQAVEHLAALGHRRIAYLSGPRISWSNRDRRRGLRAASRALGVEVVELGPFPPQFEAGLQAADLSLAAGVSAVLAFNDLVALGMLNRLTQRGVSVPREMSVVGFDNIAMSGMTTPPLTTVDMPMQLSGRVAVDLLLELLGRPLDGADPRFQRVLGTQLLVRSSTMPPLAAGRLRAEEAPA